MNLRIGEQVGAYEIIAPLGAGGAGRVFKVRHSITGRIEAMKVLRPEHEDSEDQNQRFLREIQIQAGLSHPNIVAVLNAFHLDGHFFLISELVEGESLDKVLGQGRMPLERALDYASQALAALAYAHGQGVVHRDVKPGNMIVTAQGLLKVTDFGLARAVLNPRLTASGAPLGSLYYASPEQIKGSPKPDARSDVYSLGAVLYEMATGRRPFESDQPFDLMVGHVEKIPAPPMEHDGNIPEDLNRAILRALEKDPQQRFPSAESFREALLKTRDHLRPIPASSAASASRGKPPVQDPAPTAAPAAAVPAARRARAGGPFKNRMILVAALAALALGGGAFIGHYTKQAKQPAPESKAVASGDFLLRHKLQPAGPVSAISFSGDGQRLVSVSGADSIEVWNLETGQMIARRQDDVSEAVLNRDGRRAILAGSQGVRVWDLERNQDQPVAGPPGTRYLSLSKDATYIATASPDGSVQVWDLTTGSLRGQIATGAPTQGSVALSSDGRWLAASDAPGQVRLWPLDTPSPTPREVAGPSGRILTLAFSPGGESLAAAGGSEFRVWQQDGLRESLKAALQGQPFGVAATPLGDWVVLSVEDNKAVLRNASRGAGASQFDHNLPVQAAALAPDGRLAATATEANDLWVWAARPGWHEKIELVKESPFPPPPAGAQADQPSGADPAVEQQQDARKANVFRRFGRFISRPWRKRDSK
jgi:serine/threonine-protein kinase